MPASPTAERALIDQFINALRDLPEVQAELDRGEPAGSAGEQAHDVRIDLRVAGKSFTLLIEARKVAYPRDVRAVLWQLRASSRRSPHPPGHDPVWLLVADSISPGAKALLRDERVGYYDSGGSLYLPAPRAYLYIDKPPSKSQVKSVRSLFSGRRAQVLHALLVHHVLTCWVAKAAPRKWPSTCARKGSASNGQTGDTRRLRANNRLLTWKTCVPNTWTVKI